MVFCNVNQIVDQIKRHIVTILILIDGFLQLESVIMELKDFMDVTILILIDGFLQYYILECILFLNDGHNPYFNRWFSAI